MSDWQPAETAPVDRWVIVAGDPWGDDDPPMGVDRCKDYVEDWWEQVSDTRKEKQSRTVRVWDGNASLIPTHWRELLPLPV